MSNLGQFDRTILGSEWASGLNALGWFDEDMLGQTSDVTVSLSGSSIASAIGALIVSTALALSGGASTASAGTQAPTDAVTLIGASASGGTGNVGTAQLDTCGLAGSVIASGAGTLGITTSISVAGQASVSSTGLLTDSLVEALAGSIITTNAGIVVPVISLNAIGSLLASSVGALTLASDVPLLGAALISSSGNVSGPPVGEAIVGTSIDSQAGNVTGSVLVSLSGLTLTANVGAMGHLSNVALIGSGITATTDGIAGAGVAFPLATGHVRSTESIVSTRRIR